MYTTFQIYSVAWIDMERKNCKGRGESYIFRSRFWRYRSWCGKFSLALHSMVQDHSDLLFCDLLCCDADGLRCVVAEMNEKWKVPTEVREFKFSAYPPWMQINQTLGYFGGTGDESFCEEKWASWKKRPLKTLPCSMLAHPGPTWRCTCHNCVSSP